MEELKKLLESNKISQEVYDKALGLSQLDQLRAVNKMAVLSYDIDKFVQWSDIELADERREVRWMKEDINHSKMRLIEVGKLSLEGLLLQKAINEMEEKISCLTKNW